jgi:two-component system chemotaxis response regulator CheB
VQHMPPVFTSMFAQRLDAGCALTVREARDGDALVPGTVLLAPGDYHMRVRRTGPRVAVALDQGPQENFCRPAVDPLFRSVAEVYGAATLAVVLTGMGSDGRKGAEQLRAHGCEVVVQDEQTSVVWGMPGAIAAAGLATAVLPLDQVAPAILRSLGRSALPTSSAVGGHA